MITLIMFAQLAKQQSQAMFSLMPANRKMLADNCSQPST